MVLRTIETYNGTQAVVWCGWWACRVASGGVLGYHMPMIEYIESINILLILDVLVGVSHSLLVCHSIEFIDDER